MTEIKMPRGLDLSNYSDEELGYVLRHLYTNTPIPETATVKVYKLYEYIYKYNTAKADNTPLNPPKGTSEAWSEPTLEQITALFTQAGRPDLAEGFYRYYTRKHWLTKYGKRITDLTTAISRWIQRQFKEAPASHKKADSEPSDKTENTSSTTTEKPSKTENKPSDNVRQRKTRTPKKAGANFHAFNQRTTDYDALLKQLGGGSR